MDFTNVRLSKYKLDFQLYLIMAKYKQNLFSLWVRLESVFWLFLLFTGIVHQFRVHHLYVCVLMKETFLLKDHLEKKNYRPDCLESGQKIITGQWPTLIYINLFQYLGKIPASLVEEKGSRIYLRRNKDYFVLVLPEKCFSSYVQHNTLAV